MFETIILIAMAVLFLVVLPIYATIKYWNYKPMMKYALAMIWISYLVIAYEVVNPRDSFYTNHFKEASGISFDQNMKIAYKHSSMIDIKGEYSACAIFEISQGDAELLNTTKIEEEPIKFDINALNAECKAAVSQRFNSSDVRVYKKVNEKHLRYWGFIPNSNLVFMSYNFLGTEDN